MSTECLSRTPGSHSVCAVRTPLGVDRKILSIRKEPMLSGLLSLNAQSKFIYFRARFSEYSTCAVHIEDCEGWWLSGCCGSVAEHWRLKSEVSWVRLPVTGKFFTFLYFHLITPKFIYYGVSVLQIMYDDELPSFCSGVGLVGEKVPLLLSMASSMLTSEYSSPPLSDPFRVAIGGGLEGFWWSERDKQGLIRRELIRELNCAGTRHKAQGGRRRFGGGYNDGRKLMLFEVQILISRILPMQQLLSHMCAV